MDVKKNCGLYVQLPRDAEYGMPGRYLIPPTVGVQAQQISGRKTSSYDVYSMLISRHQRDDSGYAGNSPRSCGGALTFISSIHSHLHQAHRIESDIPYQVDPEPSHHACLVDQETDKDFHQDSPVQTFDDGI